MQVIIILAVLASTQARFVDQECTGAGVVVHNILHEKEVLKDEINSPYQLAIDYDTNTLFFSYSAPKDDDTFRSGYFNLKTNEFGNIDGIQGGFANAVDRKNHMVYLGGSDGIYTFDFETAKAKYFAERDTNIWQMFFKDKLYYTSYPHEKAYVFYNGMSHEVPELRSTKVMLVAVDNNANIIFANSSGLYWHKKDKGVISFLGEYSVNGITSDINGNMFFSTVDGIHSLDATGHVQKLASMSNVYGMAVEGDSSIIYSNEESIVRLKPTKTMCFVDEKKPAMQSVENNL